MKLRKFETREEITVEIDKTNAALKARSERAEEHGKEATRLFKLSAKQKTAADIGKLIKDAQWERSQERKLIKKNQRVPKRLEALKNTLAVFDTEVMAFETSRAVVLQKPSSAK